MSHVQRLECQLYPNLDILHSFRDDLASVENDHAVFIRRVHACHIGFISFG